MLTKRIARIDTSVFPPVYYVHCCEENQFGECRMWMEVYDTKDLDTKERDLKGNIIYKPID